MASFWWIVHKDLVSEFRSRRVWPAMLLLGVVVALVFSLQVELLAEQKQQIVGGLLWLSVFFAGAMVFDRSFAAEREEGCWDGLKLLPVSPGTVYLAKLTVNVLAVTALECLLVPMFFVLSDLPLLAHAHQMALIAALASPGLAAVGTLVSALAAGCGKSGSLLVLVVLPLVIPVLFPDVPIPVDKIPAQQGTDLAYIKQLAEQVGYVFYIEPGPAPGTNIAYFGPEIKIGIPQPALNVDMDALTNVENLSFSFDPTKGVLPIVFIQSQMTRVPIPIPIPNLNPLQPPLGVLSTPLSNITLLKDTARMNPMQAISRGLAEARKSQDSVTATGRLDVLRYGRPLRARGLVGVRGAGVAYDGLYYVSSVKSTLKRGEFKQNFDLTRNGLISITPRVPV